MTIRHCEKQLIENAKTMMESFEILMTDIWSGQQLHPKVFS